MHPRPVDPKAFAQRKFAQPASCSVDIVSRYASDPPEVVRSLIEAVRPSAADGARIAELGFGSGWLLEALA